MHTLLWMNFLGHNLFLIGSNFILSSSIFFVLLSSWTESLLTVFWSLTLNPKTEINVQQHKPYPKHIAKLYISVWA